MRGWRRTAAVVAALALGAALAYWPALEGDWVWDDTNLVRPSPALQDLRGLVRASSTDLYRQAAPRLEASTYWRPLALASFWLDTRLGYAPRALHLGNVLLHAAATALLALLLLRRHRDAAGWAGAAAAAAATAWWAFHPQNVEAVAWISCRYDLLSGLALLGLLLLPRRPGAGNAALHGLVFLAGLLSKDGFGAMAAAVAAADWADRLRVRAAAPRWAALALAAAAWGAARTALAIPRFDLPAWHLVPGLLARYLDAIFIYGARALVPPPLTIGHPYGPSALGIAAGAALFAGLVALAAWRRRLAVPVAVFLAGLVPSALAIARFGEVPERYFYVPALGLALLLGDGVAACAAARPRLVRVAVPAAVAAFALHGLVRVELRLPDWRSDDALFAAALAVNPQDAQANLHVGVEASRRRDWGAAREALAVARRSDEGSGRIAGAYAWALLQTGDVGGAAREAEHAVGLEPRQPDSWWILALARHRAGDHAGELTAVDALLELSPDYPGGRPARALARCEVSGRADCLEAARAGALQ